MKRRLILAALCLILPSACRRGPVSTHETATPAASASPAPLVTAPASSAQATLDDMDTRAPVPLVPMMANHQKQNMRDHLLVVQEITAALAASDFASIERSAQRIGYTDPMGQMCAHMGAGAPGFTEMALSFHRAADGIADAARKHDANAVLAALGRTLATCTACHATFKQQVVDDATWSSLTQESASSGPKHP